MRQQVTNMANKDKQYHVIRVGPKLKAAIELQKENIKDVTYGICKPSDWEAGEIIAGKILGEI